MKIETVMIVAILAHLIITLALLYIVFVLGYSAWWLLLLLFTGYKVSDPNKDE